MQDHDWMFDVIMDLCDKAEQFGLHGMSAKLEEALDAFLDDQRRFAGPVSASGTQFAPMGPISLSQDDFIFGLRRTKPQPAAMTDPEAAPQPFASRRRMPSEMIQQLQAVRAKRDAEQQKKNDGPQDVLVLDKTG